MLKGFSATKTEIIFEIFNQNFKPKETVNLLLIVKKEIVNRNYKLVIL